MIPKEGTSWHSYPSIFALGHKALEDLFDGPVVIEEKVDGSQFSFGRFNGELRVRSKGKEMMVDAPESPLPRVPDFKGIDKLISDLYIDYWSNNG